MNFSVNIWAVLGSVVVACVLGALWFGPIFGKQWMELMGISKEQMADGKKKGMGKSYGIMIVAAFVEAFVLSAMLHMGNIVTSSAALQLAFLIWLGFIGTIMTGMVSWENKPWKLWMINSGYYLASILLMSLVLVYWPAA